MAASLARFLDRGWTLRLTAGAIVDGELRGEGERHEYVVPGILAAFQVNKRFIDEEGAIPFLMGTFAFSFSWGRNRQTEPPYIQGDPSVYAVDPRLVPVRAPLADVYSLDFRVGAVAGYTFFEVWSPYLALRAFGGPILWERDGEWVRGADRYHTQVAIGSSIFAGDSGLVLYVDWSPFLERSFSAGAGWSF